MPVTLHWRGEFRLGWMVGRDGGDALVRFVNVLIEL